MTIPESVTEIGAYAFSGCTGLTQITIPNTVATIGASAFSGCTGLKTLIIEDGDMELSLSTSTYPFNGCEVESLYVGRNLSSWRALCNSSALKEFTLGNAVTSIGEYAFSSCNGLTQVTIPNTVKTIGNCAFSDCSGLTELSIPNSVTSIDRSAFAGCTALKTLIIEDGDTQLELYSSYSNYYPFKGCTIENLYVGRNLDYWEALCNSEILKEVTIGNPVTSIGYSAFKGCSGLTGITIPNSVTSIGSSAFYGCYGLTEVTIPNSITSIGESAFIGCDGLKTLIIEDGDTQLSLYSSYSNYYPFKYCTVERLYVGRNLSSWSALCNSAALREVTIGSGVTSIGYSAFYGCTNLYYAKISDSVTEIGGSAFYDCPMLNGVTIPDSVTSIGSYAFYNCSRLKKITIPSSVTTIGYSAFANCSRLKTLIIEDGDRKLNFETIEDDYYYYPFSHCLVENLYVGRNLSSWRALCNSSALIELTIGDRVTEIGRNGFDYCSHLTVDLSKSNVSIYYDSFKGIKSLIVGSNVKMLSYNYNYSAGINVVVWLPNSSPAIKGNVTYTSESLSYLSSFFKVDGFTFVPLSPSSRTCKIIDYDFNSTYDAEVTIPEKVSYRGVEFTVEGLGDYMMVRQDNVAKVTLKENVHSIPNNMFTGCTNLRQVDIPNSVTEIGSYAFSDCNNLSDATIPDSVTTIGDFAYKGCNNLHNLTISNSLTAIGKSVFQGCWCLNEVDIPSSVVSIGESAFSGCSGMAHVNIPNSVTSIGNSAFSGCYGLTKVTIPESVTAIGESAFYGCSGLTQLTIPESITSISKSAFWGCRGLTEVIIPGSVTSISSYAFYGCSGLAQLNIPYSVDKIGEYAFANCSGLTDLDIPESISKIESSTFEGCSGLTELIIPKTVARICKNAFKDCTGLSTLILEEGNEKLLLDPTFIASSGLETVIIGRETRIVDYEYSYWEGSDIETGEDIVATDWHDYPGSPFRGMATLETAIITDVPSAVCDYLFYNCSSLKNLYIGDNVATIGTRAFSGCSSLTLFQFGKNITSIGAEALSDCSAIKDIYAEPLTPPSVGTQGLDDLDRWSCTLHVPAESMDAYKAAEQWKEFFFYEADFPISLSEESLTLAPGQTYQLTATTDSEVRWMSTNPKIATVDQNGLVTVMGVGKCSILAFNADNVMANCKINFESMETGVGAATNDSAQISIVGGEVVIEGIADNAPVYVYTPDGRMIYTGYDRRISLRPGIYIVAYPGGSRKISVR